jgi:predicted acetyltransferase
MQGNDPWRQRIPGMSDVRLVKPHAGLLPEYISALRTGWSPSNGHDLSGPHLAAIEADAAAFLAQYDWLPGSMVRLPDGSAVPRLPGQLFWIDVGEFAGFMSFRYQIGTVDLPDNVSGHAGYGVVPWLRRRGIATSALRLVLPVAAAAGLDRILITAHPDNAASCRVIEAAGGELASDLPASDAFGPRVGYWVQTAR